jgi:hypothetical protein
MPLINSDSDRIDASLLIVYDVTIQKAILVRRVRERLIVWSDGYGAVAMSNIDIVCTVVVNDCHSYILYRRLTERVKVSVEEQLFVEWEEVSSTKDHCKLEL